MIKLVILVSCLLLLGSREGKAVTCPCPGDVDIKPSDENKPSIFQDLTKLEIDGVLKYLQNDSGLDVKLGHGAKISDTIIYVIEKKPTSKDKVLNHIDRDGRRPVRESRVVLATSSGMTEYTIGPLPKPTYHRKIEYPKWRKTGLKFTDRPFPIDSFAIAKTIQREGRKMKQLLHESFNGFDFEDDCGNKCLTYDDLRSKVFQGNRLLWANVLRVVPPLIGSIYGYPLPLQILVNMTSTDSDSWNAAKVWYNGQHFDSTDDLMANYINGSVSKIAMSYNETDVYSSMRRRGTGKTRIAKRGPDCFPQDGRRYSVDGHRVKYMGWEFEFTYRQTTGPQLFDIQFKKERIVYEMSIQEILLSYTGTTTPYGSQAGVFFDSESLIGNSFSPLSPGVDCPKGASYFDSSIFSYVLSKNIVIPNLFCIFEYRDDQVLKRHYDNDFGGGYEFYSGMPNNALVLRNIISSYNYDYTISFIFYQNGVIGTKVSASGYVLCEFTHHNVPIEDLIGFKLHENVLSMFHQHLFNFKVDMDILGENNSHETLAIKVRPVTHDVVNGI
ncbi:unnamed protein product [Owenia fusiformis]|uniref:Amine oxidase n=1 Tax=Owenia fusiformis TaxID=6347 RepID=A0A8J1UP98_OWEFU|nr:unnamed protein product [Owenia fusiformis]